MKIPPESYAQLGLAGAKRADRLFILFDALLCPTNDKDDQLYAMLQDIRALPSAVYFIEAVAKYRRKLMEKGEGPYLGSTNASMLRRQRFLLSKIAVEDPEAKIFLRRYTVDKATLSSITGLAMAQVVALYQNCEEVFRERYDLYPVLAGRIEHLKLSEPDPEWYASRKPFLRSVIFSDLSKTLYYDGAVSCILRPALEEWLGGHMQIQDPDYMALAVICILAGRGEQGRKLMDRGMLAHGARSSVGFTMGMLTLLRNDPESLNYFFDGLKEFKRESRVRGVVHIGMTVGLCCNLARFLFGKSSELVVMESDIAYLRQLAVPSVRERYFGNPGLQALLALQALRSGRPDVGKAYLKDSSPADSNVLSVLIYRGARIRFGLAGEKDLEIVRSWYNRCAGLPLLQLFFADLLYELLPSNEREAYSRTEEMKNFLNFAHLVEDTPSWMLRLGTLEKMIQRGSEEESKKKREKRLVWEINLEDGLVEAVEQSSAARGGWNKGRRVSLKRLKEQGASYDWLKPQDNRIIACIGKMQDWWQTQYVLKLSEACEAMEGHPLLFVPGKNDELVPVALHRGKLELSLRDCADGECRLVLSDQMFMSRAIKAETDSCVVTRDELGNIVFYKLSEREKQIVEILGESGIVFPKQELPRVLNMTRGDFGLPLKAEINAEQRDPVNTPVFQLEQNDLTFAAVIGVRPFGRADTPFFPTGEGLVEPIAALPVFSSSSDQGNPDAALDETAARPTGGQDKKRGRLPKKNSAENTGEEAACATSLESATPQLLPAEMTSSGTPGIAQQPLLTTPVRVRRDFAAEKAVLEALAAECPVLAQNLDGHRWLSDEPEDVLQLLEELRNSSVRNSVEWPRGKGVRLSRTLLPKDVKINIEKKPGTDWFGVSGGVQIDENTFLSMRMLLNALQGSRFVSLGDGAYLALTDELRRRLNNLKLVVSEGRKNELQVNQLAAGAVEQAVSEMNVSVDKEWEGSLDRMHEAFATEPAVPRALRAQLRDYQIEGYQWMQRLAIWGVGACLADDMGLGKTLQTIAVMLNQAAKGPCLVVAPTSVCGNWELEIDRFAPTLTVHRLGLAGREDLIESLGTNDVLVLGYGLLPNVEDMIAAKDWSMIVFDEAQALKNASTKRAKAGRKLNADFRVALTGTPIENRIDDLWSLFNIINPGLLGSWENFRKRYGSAAPGTSASKALRALVRPFLLRRLKSNVLDELPSRTEQTIIVEPNEKEAVFYESLRRAAVDHLASVEAPGKRFAILSALMKLRRACCHPSLAEADMVALEENSSKTERFLEIVQELIAGGHKVLAFSQFTTYLAQVQAALTKQGIAFQYLDGTTPEKERLERVKNFQAGVGDVFLLSLKAGGTGINLTAADYVIHLDPWWNPAVEDQASDRAHRFGQTRPVTIYRLVMANTLEEKILALHAQKRELAADFLEGTETSVKALTEEELLSLLQ